jgi:CubicO group peptidase (beta-lactamase class C family)
MADFDSSPAAAEKHAHALATLKLSRPLGLAFEYSDSNYDLLGLIVEAASGESYVDYVRDHIFGPLEMRHSYTSRQEAARAGLAMGHRYWFGYRSLYLLRGRRGGRSRQAGSFRAPKIWRII